MWSFPIFVTGRINFNVGQLSQRRSVGFHPIFEDKKIGGNFWVVWVVFLLSYKHLEEKNHLSFLFIHWLLTQIAMEFWTWKCFGLSIRRCCLNSCCVLDNPTYVPGSLSLKQSWSGGCIYALCQVPGYAESQQDPQSLPHGVYSCVRLHKKLCYSHLPVWCLATLSYDLIIYVNTFMAIRDLYYPP